MQLEGVGLIARHIRHGGVETERQDVAHVGAGCIAAGGKGAKTHIMVFVPAGIHSDTDALASLFFFWRLDARDGFIDRGIHGLDAPATSSSSTFTSVASV